MLRPYDRDWSPGDCGIVQQIAFDELDATAESMPRGIASGDSESRSGNIGRNYSRTGKLFAEGDRDAARACANVDDLQSVASESLLSPSANFSERQAVQGNFDDVFCFGAGNQHVGSDFKLDAPEFLLAGDVLCGLAVGAPQNERNESMCFQAGHYFFGMRVEPRAVPAQGVHEQQF